VPTAQRRHVHGAFHPRPRRARCRRAVLANATTVRSNPSVDDRSHLNSRVLSSGVQQVPDSTVELIRRRWATPGAGQPAEFDGRTSVYGLLRILSISTQRLDWSPCRSRCALPAPPSALRL
jgi:hypothetical protein